MATDLIPQEEQLQIVAQNIKDIWKEGFVQSRLILVETYHQIGQLILTLPSKYSAVKDLARLTEISERNLYRAAKFYEKYPDFDKVPEGKNISWNKIITKYLPEQKKETECQHEFRIVKQCLKCKLILPLDKQKGE